MRLFGKAEKPEKIPEGFTADSIKIEASICTGERTIGFYDAASRTLKYAELVRREEDIAAFYRKYGIEFKG
ncbi:MAG: hypothetical protein LIO53_05680 [Oscillospiraceae bacterium]|nr:hypothetical protein [Oscillospiraceae bacterium]